MVHLVIRKDEREDGWVALKGGKGAVVTTKGKVTQDIDTSPLYITRFK